MSVCLYQEVSQWVCPQWRPCNPTPHTYTCWQSGIRTLWTHPEEGITKGGGSLIGTSSADHHDLRWHLCHHLSSQKMWKGEETACREGDCVCSGDMERETVQGYSAGGGGKFKWKKSGEGKAFMPVCVKVCQLHRPQAFPCAWQEDSYGTVL